MMNITPVNLVAELPTQDSIKVVWLNTELLLINFLIFICMETYKKISAWVKNNQTKLAIIIILLVATVATAFIWYCSIEWYQYIASHAEELTGMKFADEPTNLNIDPLRSLEMRHYQIELAMARIALIWLIPVVWCSFLGLKNKIK